MTLPVDDIERRRRSVAASLRVIGTRLEASQATGTSAAVADAARLARGFGFVVGVVGDYAISAERAWQIPSVLLARLGTLEPASLRMHAANVARACRTQPVLHRYPERLAEFVIAAAARVCDAYGGDATRLWSDAPTAATLQARFEQFRGIGQKKAAMAVDLLARDLHIDVRVPSGNDVAYDVHVRRVFLRTGITQHDTPAEVIGAARALAPDRPASLDRPAWHIGRTYCRPTAPICEHCPLEFACGYAGRTGPSRGRQLILFRA